jgi:DNA-binding response OmpR family regulator
MVIEDPDVRAMLGDVLRAEGYAVVPCSPSREKCLDELIDVRPDLVILDVPLGRPAFNVEDAVDLVDGLRAHPTTANVPIVICTTVEPALCKHRSHLNGLKCDFISKPFELSELLDTVTQRVRPKAASA